MLKNAGLEFFGRIRNLSVHYRLHEQQLILIGHTYPHRERMKAIGARYIRDAKVWSVADSAATRAAVDAFCKELGGGRLDVDASSEPRRETTTIPLDPEPVALERSHSDYTIRRLVEEVSFAIQARFSERIWIVAEVQSKNERSSGMYLTLAEAKMKDIGSRSSQGTYSVSATLWNEQWRLLKQKYSAEVLNNVLQEGVELRVAVEVKLYRERASLSLNIVDLDPAFTKGALALRKQKTMASLRAKGLDRRQKALPLTLLPQRVGLVSAHGSRAYSDFCHQLESGGFFGEVFFCSAPMQGEQLVSGVVQALKHLEQMQCDIIVITRGGGSTSDLFWFDDEALCVVAANLTTPILAAIGHHDDQSILEEIAAIREKTPTAAADFLLVRQRQAREKVLTHTAGLISLMDARFNGEKHKLLRHSNDLGARALWQIAYRMTKLEHAQPSIDRAAMMHLQDLKNQLERFSLGLFDKARTRLLQYDETLHQLRSQMSQRDPKPWLERGWTQLSRGDGTLVRESRYANLGDLVFARLLDGRLGLRVETLEKK